MLDTSGIITSFHGNLNFGLSFGSGSGPGLILGLQYEDGEYIQAEDGSFISHG